MITNMVLAAVAFGIYALITRSGPLPFQNFTITQITNSGKVDLAAISILELVEQYLAYLDQAKSLKLEIAADYLVMAAWLAYLKSCLLLPRDPEADPSAEEIARLRLLKIDVEGAEPPILRRLLDGLHR